MLDVLDFDGDIDLDVEGDRAVVSIDGGSVTTIPVQCTAKIALRSEDVARAREIAERVVGEVKHEHKESDPGIMLVLSDEEKAAPSIPADVSDSIIKLLHMMPSGLVDTSLVFPGLPISSYSLETITTTEDKLNIFYRPQSALTTKLFDMVEQTKELVALYGADYAEDNKFFGHCVDAHTPLYDVYDEVWFEQNGEHIRPIGAHYGNEIGFFMSNMPWLDMILLVATHYAAHTPDEKLDLASFDRCYKALVEILARL